ncbi:MAG: OmpA family protein [Opitutales bacterium]
MKRLLLLVLVAGLGVGCTSKLPDGFDTTGKASGGGNSGGPTGLDTRPPGFGDMAGWVRSGNIPPEAILTTVYFDFDRYTVSAAERGKLNAISGRARETKIIVAGYTDHFGTEEYNLGLSDRRAQSVREYLVGLGCANANIEIIALGEQQADKNAAGRQSGAKDRKAIVVDVNYAGAIKQPVSGPAPAPAPAPSADGAPPVPPSAL